MGEGSRQRAATISKFQLIWKGGAEKIPVGVACGHPGLTSRSCTAFGRVCKLGGKAPGRAHDSWILYQAVWAGSQAPIEQMGT